MKKTILLCSIAVLLVACGQKGPERYTQNSPEIDTIKKLIANYNAKTYDTGIYADTSKTFYNTRKKGMSPSETMEYHKQNDVNYSSRGFIDRNQEFEMTITDEGKTWVNAWVDWNGTLTATGEKFEIPIHMTFQFIDGKIVREVGYWNSTEVVLALQRIEAEAKMKEEELAE